MEQKLYYIETLGGVGDGKFQCYNTNSSSYILHCYLPLCSNQIVSNNLHFIDLEHSVAYCLVKFDSLVDSSFTASNHRHVLCTSPLRLPHFALTCKPLEPPRPGNQYISYILWEGRNRSTRYIPVLFVLA
jgi:hypothetical protein